MALSALFLATSFESLRSEFAAKPSAHGNHCRQRKEGKPLRTEIGSCEFNSRDMNSAFIDFGIARRACEPNPPAN